MKTTIELPDELLARAKATAARRRTTLKSMIEHALKRELLEDSGEQGEVDCIVNKYGFPVLNSPETGKVSSEDIYRLLEEEA